MMFSEGSFVGINREDHGHDARLIHKHNCLKPSEGVSFTPFTDGSGYAIDCAFCGYPVATIIPENGSIVVRVHDVA